MNKLKDLIAEQIPVLDVALSVHKSKAPPAILPLQSRLEECFLKMQLHVESTYGKRSTDLKFERESTVILRKGVVSASIGGDNRLSETSMGSSE